MKNRILSILIIIISIVCLGNYLNGQSLCTPGNVENFTKISNTQGSFTGVFSNSESFGTSIDTIGDLDNDGVIDLVVGSLGDNDGGNKRGAAWILFMNQDGTVKSFQKISDTQGNFTATFNDWDYFGVSVCGIGDMDGDGNPDVAVGAEETEDGGHDVGTIYILFLNSDGTVKNYTKIASGTGGFTGVLEPGDYFGTSLTAMGDLDNDGVMDIAAGAIHDDDGGSGKGAVWILFLNSDGTVKSHQKISATEGGFTGALDIDDEFGHDLNPIGDLNNDGVTELAVTALRDDDGGNDRGAIWILFLNSNGTVSGYQKISSTQGGFTETIGDNDILGESVAGIGDFDSDGVPDIAVSDEITTDHPGAVWIIFLNSTGSVKSLKKITANVGNFTGVIENGDYFGKSLTCMKDFNGDGNMEIAAGAYGDDDGGTDYGAVWLLSLCNYISTDTLTTTINTLTPVVCFGSCTGSASVTATGGVPPYSYLWSNGAIGQIANGLCTGVYHVFVQDAQLDSSIVYVTITQPSEALTASIISIPITCFGSNNGSINLSVSGGTPPYTYLWNNGQTIQDPTGLPAGIYTATVTDANLCTVTASATITQPSGLISSVSSTNITCNGGADGTFEVYVAGGTAPYTYIWNNGNSTATINGGSAGSYTVTITDNNGCTTSGSVIVTEPSAIAITANVTDATCNNNDGSAYAIVTGGVAPYTYLWNDPNVTTTDVVTNLPAGNYFVTVTDNNECSSVAGATIQSSGGYAVITGMAQFSLGFIGAGDGTVELYQAYIPGFSTVSASEIFANGQFILDSVPPGDYFLYVKLDNHANNPNYNTLHNTYYDSTYRWIDATIFTVSDCDTLNFVVNMYEKGNQQNGNGTISGNINYHSNNKAINGEPVPGAEIILEQEPDDEPIAFSSTDSTGFYEFTNLIDAVYTVYVDIPGLPLISTYTVTIGGSDTIHADLNFFIDTITSGPGIYNDSLVYAANFKMLNNSIAVFPNPFTNQFQLTYNLTLQSKVNITLFDMNGRLIKEVTNSQQEQGAHSALINTKQISVGTYLLKVSIDNNTYIKKITRIE